MSVLSKYPTHFIRIILVSLLTILSGEAWVLPHVLAQEAEEADSAEITNGERLFLETRFAQFFKVFLDDGGSVNDPLPAGDLALDKLVHFLEVAFSLSLFPTISPALPPLILHIELKRYFKLVHKRKESTMPFQFCPQCQKRTLAPTGAFWCCTDCDTAITSRALAAMRATSYTQENRQPLLVRRSL